MTNVTYLPTIHSQFDVKALWFGINPIRYPNVAREQREGRDRGGPSRLDPRSYSL